MGAAIGVVYVAYGERARNEAQLSIASLKRQHDWPVLAVTDAMQLKGADVTHFHNAGWGARRAKLHVDQIAPWDAFLYLDADTRIRGDLSAGFDILADGWDMAIAPSENQETKRLWHIGDTDRALTLALNPCPLQLQGGVFYCQRNAATHALFDAWREEWERFETYDQGALIRALYRSPVKVWLLGKAHNNGELVQHLFGKARLQ